MVFGGAVSCEGQFPDQRGHGEPDPAEPGDSGQVGPGQALLQRTAGQLCGEERRRKDADRLSHDQRCDDADRDRVGQRRPQPGQAADRHSGGAQREQRDGDPRRDRPPEVLEVFCQPGPIIVTTVDTPGADGDGEPEEDPGHGGVNPGRMEQGPGEKCQRQQRPPRPHPALHQHHEHTQRKHCGQRPDRLQVVGVEQGDRGDRQQVVHHGQGERPTRSARTPVRAKPFPGNGIHKSHCGRRRHHGTIDLAHTQRTEASAGPWYQHVRRRQCAAHQSSSSPTGSTRAGF